MKTEITEKEKVNGWIGYDVDCPLCRRLAGRWGARLATRGLIMVPLQTPEFQALCRVPLAELMREMKLVRGDGVILGGAAAWLEICRHFWCGWPVYGLGKLPGIKPVLAWIYAWVAANRHCLGGGCRVPPAPGRWRHSVWWQMPILMLVICEPIF